MADTDKQPMKTTDRQLMGVVRQFFRNELVPSIRDEWGTAIGERWNGLHGWFGYELKQLLIQHFAQARNGRTVEGYLDDLVRKEVIKAFSTWGARPAEGHINTRAMGNFTKFVEEVVRDETEQQLRKHINVKVDATATMPVPALKPMSRDEKEDMYMLEDIITRYVDTDKIDSKDAQRIEMYFRRNGYD